MQSISINRDKIDKSALYQGKTGTYLNLTLMENRDGPDKYGNDGFVVQDIGKDRRQKGEKGPIVGNWRYIGEHRGGQQSPPPARTPAHSSNQPAQDEEGDIPF